MKVISIDKTSDLKSDMFGKFASKITKMSFILLVHAPWCGHCQMLKPKLEEAINASKDLKVTLVKISDEPYTHLTNTHPQHPLTRLLTSTVSGFPTLMHVRSHQTPEKTAMIYKMFEGERATPQLKAFIKDHADKVKASKTTKTTKPKSKSPTPKPKIKKVRFKLPTKAK
jgi:thiol-disulfide isomerase/thioredoxin